MNIFDAINDYRNLCFYGNAYLNIEELIRSYLLFIVKKVTTRIEINNDHYYPVPRRGIAAFIRNMTFKGTKSIKSISLMMNGQEIATSLNDEKRDEMKIGMWKNYIFVGSLHFTSTDLSFEFYPGVKSAKVGVEYETIHTGIINETYVPRIIFLTEDKKKMLCIQYGCCGVCDHLPGGCIFMIHKREHSIDQYIQQKEWKSGMYREVKEYEDRHFNRFRLLLWKYNIHAVIKKVLDKLFIRDIANLIYSFLSLAPDEINVEEISDLIKTVESLYKENLLDPFEISGGDKEKDLLNVFIREIYYS